MRHPVVDCNKQHHRSLPLDLLHGPLVAGGLLAPLVRVPGVPGGPALEGGLLGLLRLLRPLAGLLGGDGLHPEGGLLRPLPAQAPRRQPVASDLSGNSLFNTSHYGLIGNKFSSVHFGGYISRKIDYDKYFGFKYKSKCVQNCFSLLKQEPLKTKV